MIKIIDNFLDDDSFNNIKYFVDDPNLSWKRGKMLPEDLIVCDQKENFQDAHIIYCNGNYVKSELNFIIPILKRLEAKVLLKAKINKTYPTQENLLVGWHTDTTEDHWASSKNPKTAIYYVNNNDGSTIIKEDEKEVVVNCVENRLVIFDTYLKHTAMTCSRSKYKLIININFY